MAPATARVGLEERLWAFAQRRRLPPPDLASLNADAWTPAARTATAFVWNRRVLNETRSVELARDLGVALDAASLLTAGAAAACQRLGDDESLHTELAASFLKQVGAEVVAVAPEALPVDGGAPTLAVLRRVATGLAVCETVSAVRFAVVRRHTDLPIPRACIELFLRDEVAHARLGFLLLPHALSWHAAAVGRSEAEADLDSELKATFRHLDLVVGLDAERRGLRLVRRPQPPANAGVVEPALDALAYYDAVTQTILPRLRKVGIEAEPLWSSRWAAS